jgi:hypothetical protein
MKYEYEFVLIIDFDFLMMFAKFQTAAAALYSFSLFKFILPKINFLYLKNTFSRRKYFFGIIVHIVQLWFVTVSESALHVSKLNASGLYYSRH